MAKLRDKAYEAFIQNLLAKNIRSGQFVSQRELVDLTGMPLGAVREMIPRLETDGLVETLPQRGMQIASIDLKLVRNTFQLRVMLEKEAAVHFTRTASDEEIKILATEHEKIIKRAKGKASDQLLEDAQKVSQRLHDSFIDSLGNEIVSQIYRVNSLKIHLIRLERAVQTPDTILSTMAEQMAIIEGIKARNPSAVVQALEAHIDGELRRAMGI